MGENKPTCLLQYKRNSALSTLVRRKAVELMLLETNKAKLNLAATSP